jgi:hypothetical protein
MPASPSTWVEFPAFRQYESTRQEANNAMMALLAGSKLAAHTLQLTTGSRQLLPDIFPGVEHISYFNLRTDSATVLVDTGHHLGAVTVPYALAVHEDFVMTTLALLEQFGYTRKAPGKAKGRIAAWNMHEALYVTLGDPPPARGSSVVELEHFHLLREMRNAQIHDGGSISPRLRQEVSDMSGPAATDWLRLARRTPADVISCGKLSFTIFDIFTVFATTKSLGRTLNTLLRDKLTTSQWAKICVEDYRAQSSKYVGSDQWIRGLIGHTALYYRAAGLTEQDVIDAAVEVGLWTAGRGFTARRTSRGAVRSRKRGTMHPDGEI